jgi:hypothetical protein
MMEPGQDGTGCQRGDVGVRASTQTWTLRAPDSSNTRVASDAVACVVITSSTSATD